MPPHGIHELGDDLFVHVPDDPWANTGIVVGDDAVLLVDARVTARMAREMVDIVRHITPKPIRYLVNTHQHGDHVFGNCVFAPTAAIIAHANAQRYLAHNPGLVDEWRRRHASLVEDLAEVVVTPPVISFTDSLSLHLGKHTLELRHFGHGHTDGDAVVFVAGEQVAYLGDLLSNGHYPVMADADSHGWECVLEAVEARPDAQRLAGGHGPAGDRSTLAEQRACLRATRAAVKDLYENGVPVEKAAAGLRSIPGFERYLYPERLGRSVGRLYEELAAQGQDERGGAG